MAKKPKYSEAELLEHILDLCDTIEREIGARTFDEFGGDRNLADATAYRLQAIGEACIKLKAETKDRHDVPWTEIIGMRQILSHDYLSISKTILWTTAKTNLVELRAACEAALAAERGG